MKISINSYVATIKLQTIAEPAKTRSEFAFTDLHLDLELDYTRNNEFLRRKEIKDLKIDYDYAAIRNSIFNLLTTVPGQRILNPEFGLGIQKYLFLQANERTARAIGNEILNGIVKYEPRIQIENINVAVDELEQQYVISLAVSVKSINPTTTIKLVGLLSNTGFNFIT
jgi:phage baseplate assembly protein W